MQEVEEHLQGALPYKEGKRTVDPFDIDSTWLSDLFLEIEADRFVVDSMVVSEDTANLLKKACKGVWNPRKKSKGPVLADIWTAKVFGLDSVEDGKILLLLHKASDIFEDEISEWTQLEIEIRGE